MVGISITLDGIACDDWGADEGAALIGTLAAVLSNFGCDEDDFDTTTCVEARRRLQSSNVGNVTDLDGAISRAKSDGLLGGAPENRRAQASSVIIGTAVDIDSSTDASGDDPVASLHTAIEQSLSNGTFATEFFARAGTTSLTMSTTVEASKRIRWRLRPRLLFRTLLLPRRRPADGRADLVTDDASVVRADHTSDGAADRVANEYAHRAALVFTQRWADDVADDRTHVSPDETAERRADATAERRADRQLPSPNPTPATALLMTDVLPFEATKPDFDTRRVFILNQNQEDLFGEFRVEAAANISWQAVIIGEREGRLSNEPANYTVDAGSLVSVDITLYSDGLNADAYPVVIKVGGKTINSLHVEVEQTTTFTVTSYAVAEQLARGGDRRPARDGSPDLGRPAGADLPVRRRQPEDHERQPGFRLLHRRALHPARRANQHGHVRRRKHAGL